MSNQLNELGIDDIDLLIRLCGINQVMGQLQPGLEFISPQVRSMIALIAGYHVGESVVDARVVGVSDDKDRAGCGRYPLGVYLYSKAHAQQLTQSMGRVARVCVIRPYLFLQVLIPPSV